MIKFSNGNKVVASLLVGLSLLFSSLSPALVRAATPSEISQWTTEVNNLPQTRAEQGTALYNGYVYQVGGSGAAESDSTVYAKIQEDGSVGSWQASAHDLPQPNFRLNAIAHDGYLYAIGGRNGPALNTIYRAALDAETGAPGAWSTEANTMPSGLYYHSSFIFAEHLYVIGGDNNSAVVDTVYIAPIAAGEIGTWTEAEDSLPVELSLGTVVVHNDYVYLIGGRDSENTASNKVYYTVLADGGNIGNWVQMSDTLPQGIFGASSVKIGDEIFVIGGNNGSTKLTTIYHATITEPGETAAGWQLADAELPTSMEQGGAITYNDETYTFGGLSGSFQAAVYSTVPQPVEFDGGDGSEESPYSISTCEQLQAMQDDLAAHYVLGDDVDCSMTNPEDPDFDESGRWGDEKGFDPIGNSGDGDEFTGTLNGNDRSVSDLYINRPDENHVGLFGKIKNTSVISLILDSTEITGNAYVGALAGEIIGEEENEADLANIGVNDGSVTGLGNVGGVVGQVGWWTEVKDSHVDTAVSGLSYVGGFVGSSWGSTLTGNTSESTVLVEATEGAYDIGGFIGFAACESTLTDIESYGDVTAEHANGVGGLVGSDGCEGPGSIYTRASAGGDVVGKEGVGGFIGRSYHSMFDRAYATGSVTGDDIVGGFAGSLYGYSSEEYTKGVVDRSYSVGEVNGGDKTGGFVGSDLGGIYTNSYTRSNVDASSAPGGFIGTVEGDGGENQPTKLTNVYAANQVQAGVYPKGLIGINNSDYLTVTNSFWDQELANTEPTPYGEPKTTTEMKSVNTFTSQLGDEAWDFEDIWGFGEEINAGYPCLQWSMGEGGCEGSGPTEEPGEDSDNDNVSDEIEDAGPNDGDANEDGTPDSEQAHVASFLNPVTGHYSVLDVFEECSINRVEVVAEENVNETGDDGYKYPAGLMDFSINCGEGNAGLTATIVHIHYGIDLKDFSLRKYTPARGYLEVEGAQISEEQLGDETATVAEYRITDGEQYDIDGEANGTIEDPAGLAEATSSDLADTGSNVHSMMFVALALLISGAIITLTYQANKASDQQ